MLKPASYIDSMGVELEGAWIRIPEGEDLTGDSSVSVNGCVCERAGGSCTGATCARQRGEIVSRPLKLPELLEWVKVTYPDKSDKTCGMHIHVSVIDKLSYMRLMSKGFYNYFLTRVTKWGVEKKINEGTIFWERLTGQNRFCERKFRPEEQIKIEGKGSHRYTHLNFSWTRHGTVECRLFPAFQKKELSLSAIELFADIVETYLKRQHREKSVIEEVIDDTESLDRTEELCV